MPQHYDQYDSADDDADDAEDPDPSDMDDDDDGDDTPTIACPHCGEEVYEFLDTCPECGQSVVAGAARTGHPRWVIITAAALLLLMLYALTRWVLG